MSLLEFYPCPKPAHSRIRTENGIEYRGGREICVTRDAWEERREFVWRRDHGRCYRCHRPVPLHTRYDDETGVVIEWSAIIDHIVKRAMGGAKRDDRPANLRTVCHQCDVIRESGSKPCPRKVRA